MGHTDPEASSGREGLSATWRYLPRPADGLFLLSCAPCLEPGLRTGQGSLGPAWGGTNAWAGRDLTLSLSLTLQVLYDSMLMSLSVLLL